MLAKPATPVKNWEILLEHTFATCIPLPVTTTCSAFRLGRKSSSPWRYLCRTYL